MLTKEELDSWNELFPYCKIRESDLTNPTEAFLTKTLISYLQTFGYKVTHSFPLNNEGAAETLREKRLFQIKLARQIDHILKITDKSYAFLYYDLIRPSPKKTAHMLGILLNYLYYYNMYKTDVFAMASKRLQAHQELQQCIAKTQQENMERSEYAEKIKSSIVALSAQVPAAKTELNALSAEISEQKDQLKREQESSKRLEAQLEELKALKRNLKQQLVPDVETIELQKKLKKLQQNINEQKQVKSNAECQLKEFNDHINALQTLIQQISETHEIVPLQQLENFKEDQLKLKEAKKLAQNVERKDLDLLQMIEKQEQVLKSFEGKMQQKRAQFNQEKSEKQQALVSKEKQCQSKKTQLEYLQNQEHAMECLLEEQKDIRNYLHESITALILNN